MAGVNEKNIPIPFLCPLSMDLMKDPVTLSTGITYDRYSIEKWFEQGNTYCPVTSQQITYLHDHIIPNHTLRRIFHDWSVQQQHIPAPIIPVTSVEVKEILSRFTVLTQHSDHLGCRSLVKKIMTLCNESDCNAECFDTNGTTTLLSAAFHTFSSVCLSPSTAVELLLKDILALLALMLPLSQTETSSSLASQSSLSFILWVLIWGDLPEKRNAVLVLEQLLSSNEKHAAAVANMHGQVDVFLLQLIKNPICNKTKKASLLIISYLVNSSERIMSRLLDMELIPLVLTILVDSNKKVSETALIVLDGICNSHQGRNKALNHVQFSPLLVKKLLRISDTANCFILSIFWKLWNNLEEEEKAGVLTVYSGAFFQKLLLLLQVSCTDEIKGMAKRNAVLVLEQLLSSNEKHAAAVANMHGQVDVFLLQLIKNPICDETKEASLLIISYLVNSSERVMSRLLDMELIPLAQKFLTDSNKKVSEIALIVLDEICNSHQGRDKALNDAQFLPLLVKKLLRISDTANGFILSIFWKVCSNLEEEEKADVLTEYLGAFFQKLLLLLQVSCTDEIKGMVKNLLKLLSRYGECSSLLI